MNKKVLVLFIVISWFLHLESQKLYVQGGANISELRVHHHRYPDFINSEIFNRPSVVIGIGMGIELFEDKTLTFPIFLQFNQLGSSVGSDFYGDGMKTFYNLNNRIVISQFSLFPMAKLKVFKIDKSQFSFQTGVKLDYTFHRNNFSSDNYILRLYDESTREFTLTSSFGLGYEYQFSEKIGIVGYSSYNFPITRLANLNSSVEVDYIHNINNPFEYMEADAHYIQFQVGVSYKLNRL